MGAASWGNFLVSQEIQDIFLSIQIMHSHIALILQCFPPPAKKAIVLDVICLF